MILNLEITCIYSRTGRLLELPTNLTKPSYPWIWHHFFSLLLLANLNTVNLNSLLTQAFFAFPWLKFFPANNSDYLKTLVGKAQIMSEHSWLTLLSLDLNFSQTIAQTVLKNVGWQSSKFQNCDSWLTCQSIFCWWCDCNVWKHH